MRQPPPDLSRAGRFRTGTLLNIATVVSGVYLVVVVLVLAASAVTSIVYFDGYAADGPFQLYNPLRRLAAGQLAGHDFPFFHGIGIVLLHFPLFELFGGDLAASETSRWIVSPVLFFASAGFLGYALTRSVRRTVVFMAILAAVVFPMGRMIDPSNSLLGVRTTLPIVIAGLLLWRGARVRRIWRVQFTIPMLVAHLLAGLAVLMGTEQGAAAAIALVVIVFVRRVRYTGSVWVPAALAARDAILIGVATVFFAWLFSGGHPIETLRYALVDVPQDQGWVFGAPPNVAPTWQAILAEIRGGATLAWNPVPSYEVLWVGSILAVVAVMLTGRAPRQIVWVSAFLSLYGIVVLASVTGYINFIDQMAPLARGAATTLSLATVSYLFPRELPLPAPAAGRLRRVLSGDALWVGALVSAAIVLAVAIPTRIASINFDNASLALQRIQEGRGLEDYDILADRPADSSTEWKESYDEFAPYLRGADVTVWSLYQSAYDSIDGRLTPASGGEDYVIHALGPDRREAYTRDFAAAASDFVITMNPEYFQYEEWLWSRWPGVYSTLFAGYEPVAANQSHVLWQKTSTKRSPAAQEPLATNGTGAWVLPANDTDEVALYSVTVDYAAQTAIPPLNRIARYLLIPEGTGLTYPISLPSYESTWTFVVPVLPGQDGPVLRSLSQGLIPGDSLTVEEASISPIEITPSIRALLSFNYCASTYVQDVPRCGRSEPDSRELRGILDSLD